MRRTDTSQIATPVYASGETAVPIILAFLVFQKRITEGIAMTGLKGMMGNG